MRDHSAAGPEGPGRLLQLAVFAVLMTAVCWASLSSAREFGQAAPIWPANAITLTALLVAPPRRWPGWLVAAWAGNFVAARLTGGSLPLSVVLSSCNSFEVTLAAVLLRRILGRFDPARADHLLRFFLIGGVLAPLAAATAAVVSIHLVRGGGTLRELLTWAAADGLGVMIVVPLLLTLRDARQHLTRTPLRTRGWLAIGGVGLATLVVCASPLQMFFLIAPAILLVVFELEVLGAALALVVAMGLGSAAVGFGHHPLDVTGLDVAERFLLGQIFLASIVLTSFLTGAVLAQRRRLKIELDEQYRRVKLAEDVAGIGYWRFDYDRQTLEFSDAVRAAYGIGEAADPAASLVLDGIHPDDREAVIRQVRAVHEAGGELSMQYRIVRPDGEVRHVLAKTCRERGADGVAHAVFGAFFDVTDLRRAQDELVEREARYRLLADSATDIVIKVDRDDAIQYVSPSARRYGYEPEDLIGVSGVSLVHPEDAAKLKALIVDLFSGDEVDPARDRTYRLRSADGSYSWMEGNPAIIRDEAGRPTAVVSQLRDITQRKAMEAELLAAREAAEAAAAVKADFMANMSHELRTPLTSVLGFTRLALEQPDLDPTTRAYIAKASSAGAALLTTVNDILDFSRLESGQLQVRPTPSDADAICRSTLELFSAGAEAKGVRLAYEAEGLPAHVMVDPDRLRQVLLNLIGNAVKFSDAGEVRLAVRWSEADRRLRVAVTDQGPGISPEQQSLLFRRFSQVDGSATRRYGGTGLGLAICLGLVEAMGGTIGVESEQGQGARFFFDLPAEPCEAAAELGQAAPEIPPGVRVLVADDHAVNRELVRAILTPLGAEVTDAANGAEALAAASRSPFDIILMDLRMPELDGLGAMSAIRAGEGPNRDAPILAFSAGADEPGAKARRAAGFNGDLSKPILPLDLMLAVARHARPSPAAARPARKTRRPTKAKVQGTKP